VHLPNLVVLLLALPPEGVDLHLELDHHLVTLPDVVDVVVYIPVRDGKGGCSPNSCLFWVRVVRMSLFLSCSISFSLASSLMYLLRIFTCSSIRCITRTFSSLVFRLAKLKVVPRQCNEMGAYSLAVVAAPALRTEDGPIGSI